MELNGDFEIKTSNGNVFRKFAKNGTVSAYLIRTKEFSMKSKTPWQQTRWDLVYYVMPIKSLSRNIVRVVQFKIHSGFRSEVRPRNPHTPIPELALQGHCLDSSGKSMEYVSKKSEWSYVWKSGT